MNLPLCRRTRPCRKCSMKIPAWFVWCQWHGAGKPLLYPNRHLARHSDHKNPNNSHYLPHSPMFDVLQALRLGLTFIAVRICAVTIYNNVVRPYRYHAKRQTQIRKRPVAAVFPIGVPVWGAKRCILRSKRRPFERKTLPFTMRTFTWAFICRRH